MSETKSTQTQRKNSNTGAKKVSLTFRVDSGIIEHNNRDFIAKNVNAEKIQFNIFYKQESLEDKYHELFDEAVREYNERQKRSDRKISDYLEHIKSSKQEQPFYEAVVQIGDMYNCGIGTENENAAKEMLDEYMLDFEKRNPNIRVFNAVMHLDEASPHLHIDFVPICNSPNRGLPVRVSLKGALKEQGFGGKNAKETDRQVWAISEKNFLAEILKKHGFEQENKNVHRAHMDVDEYKEYAADIKRINDHINVLKQKPTEKLTQDEMAMIKNQNDFMRGEIEKRNEHIKILSQRAGAKFIPVNVWSQEKITFISAELERVKIPFVEGGNCIFIPDYAEKTCAAIAGRFSPQQTQGVRAEIAYDIDRLILSSENFSDLLAKLKEQGYEIKEGKYLAVKSPKAQRFVRLRSLGEDYLPNNIEKRIANRDKFPNVVREKSKNANEIEQKFYITISQTIIEIKMLRYKPRKTNPQKPYTFSNDKDIDNLSDQLLTIRELGLNSREKIYSKAEEISKDIAEKNEKIAQLADEIPTLKSDIAQIKLLFSTVNTKDTMQQMKLAAAREKAEKYGIKSEDDLQNLQRRLDLIPTYSQNLKAELSEQQLELKRVQDLIDTYEKITEDNYISGLIAAQKEREAAEKNQNKTV